MADVLSIRLEASGEERRLDQGAMGIGRGQGNEWVLPDTDPEPTLSRRHCRLAAEGDGFTITDLGSTNGTRLNGQPVPAHSPTPLQTGDVLDVGPHRLVVTLRSVSDAGLHAVPAAPLSLTGGDDDLFGGLSGPAASPAPPDRPPPRAGDSRSLDDIFGQWSGAGRESPAPPSAPHPLEADPLAGLFQEELAPLPPGRPPTDDAGDAAPLAAPQFEALTPRARAADRDGPAAVPPASPKAPPTLPDDPFGLGEVDSTERRLPAAPPADPPPIEPPAAEPPPAEEAPAVMPAMPEPPAAPPFRAPPPAQGPTPPAPVQADALLAAFLAGAGMDAARMAPDDPEAFMRDAGRAFARLAEGLRELLQVRATIKEHVRVDKTQIGAAQNNPLKYSINPHEATAALLRRREQGYLAPLPAIEASFRDLKAHELGLLEGLQSAVGELLGSFDPATLEQQLGDAGALSTLLQGGRRARLWELYTERYEDIAKGARTRFMGHFDGAFRTAYARKSAEVSAASPTPEPGASQ